MAPEGKFFLFYLTMWRAQGRARRRGNAGERKGTTSLRVFAITRGYRCRCLVPPQEPRTSQVRGSFTLRNLRFVSPPPAFDFGLRCAQPAAQAGFVTGHHRTGHLGIPLSVSSVCIGGQNRGDQPVAPTNLCNLWFCRLVGSSCGRLVVASVGLALLGIQASPHRCPSVCIGG